MAELPDGVAEHLPQAIASMEARMKPVPADVFAGLMVRLWDSGVPKPEEATLMQWRRLLGQYPADVLSLAFDEVAKSHAWPRPPAVADVMRYVRPEMERRNSWLRKLKTAKVRAEMDAMGRSKNEGTAYSDMTDAERADFDRRLGELKASLGMHSMPGTVRSKSGRTSASEWEGITDNDIPRLREQALRGLEAGQ